MISHKKTKPGAAIQRHSGVCTGVISTLKADLRAIHHHCAYLANNGYKHTITYHNAYCILIGNDLNVYADYDASVTGAVLLKVRIVGSSAWSGNARTHSNSCKFRIVTYTGSQLNCICKDSQEVEIWLAALHTGLEANFADSDVTSSTLLTPPSSVGSQCMSCGCGGGDDDDDDVITVTNAIHTNHTNVNNDTNHHNTGDNNTGDNNDGNDNNNNYHIPLPHYGCELTAYTNVCYDCYVAQGVLNAMMTSLGLVIVLEYEHCALGLARDMVLQVLTEWERSEKDARTDPCGEGSHSDASSSTSSWEHLPTTNTNIHTHTHSNVVNDVINVMDNVTVTVTPPSILHLLTTPGFHTLRRRSRTLEIESRRLLHHTVTLHDYLNLIAPGDSESSHPMSEELLLQSFAMCADIGSLVSLLKDYAWDTEREGSVCMVRCILVYLLRVARGDESSHSDVITSLQFYLPQLYMIHTHMLPPRSATAVQCLWLYENFLLDLSVRNVYIATAVAWHNLAELRLTFTGTMAKLADGDSVGRGMTSRDGYLRKFLCEVESVLFGLDAHWGGGSITLMTSSTANMTSSSSSPSQSGSTDQRHILQSTMEYIQALKLSSSRYCLPGSVLYNNDVTSTNMRRLELAARYRNQLNFHRSLGQLAEDLHRLSFHGTAEQQKYLSTQLQILNQTQAFGLGLPMTSSTANFDQLATRVVRIPHSEGHVFRSKARTPVLLVMEVWYDDDDVSVGVRRDTDNEDPPPLTVMTSSNAKVRRLVLTTLTNHYKDKDNSISSSHIYQSIQRLDRVRAQQLLRCDDDVTTDGDDVITVSGGVRTDPAEDEVMEALRLLLLAGVHRPGLCDSLYMTDADDDVSIHKDAGVLDARLAGCGPLSRGIHQALTLYQNGTLSTTELLELVKSDRKFVLNDVTYGANLSHGDVTGRGLFQEGTEDSAFWVRFAFGERWAEKRARIAATSPYATTTNSQHTTPITTPSTDSTDSTTASTTSQPQPPPPQKWDLQSVIIKANDDVRQEAFIMQLIQLCRIAWDAAGLQDDLWVRPYAIVATGVNTGMIETISNALSFDALKKRRDHHVVSSNYNGTNATSSSDTSSSSHSSSSSQIRLLQHFERMTKYAADPAQALATCKSNFIKSLAAYSLICHLFQVKDRHNGNILLDTAGHVIHIDFGFVFGIAPGGAFSLEAGTPFKLTEEMIEVMGGVGSPLFTEFVTLFCCGFLALQRHVDRFLTVIEVTYRSMGAGMPCFAALGVDGCKQVLDTTRQLFRTDLASFQPDLQQQDENKTSSDNNNNNNNTTADNSSKHLATVRHALELIKTSMSSYGTSQYDYFQYMSQGIAA